VQLSALKRLVAVLALIGATEARAQSLRETYDLDERCGKRALETFTRQYGDGFSKTKDTQTIYNYRNHYNAKVNKCFYAVTTRMFITDKGKREELRTVELFNLNENNRYGIFIGIVGKATPSDTCEVREDICDTEAQWWRLANIYLEN
jgi:hypothetical protein